MTIITPAQAKAQGMEKLTHSMHAEDKDLYRVCQDMKQINGTKWALVHQGKKRLAIWRVPKPVICVDSYGVRKVLPERMAWTIELEPGVWLGEKSTVTMNMKNAKRFKTRAGAKGALRIKAHMNKQYPKAIIQHITP